MSVERWREEIKGKPGELARPTFYRTEPEPIKAMPGATISYLSVEEGDQSGLQPGVYVETNITPEDYQRLTEVRALIVGQIAVDLGVDKSKLATRTPQTPPIGLPQPGVETVLVQPIAMSAHTGAVVLSVK